VKDKPERIMDDVANACAAASLPGQYGLRIEALSMEARRIVTGPERRNDPPKAGVYYTWPYVRVFEDFTPMMRRILRGKHTRYLLVPDYAVLY